MEKKFTVEVYGDKATIVVDSDNFVAGIDACNVWIHCFYLTAFGRFATNEEIQENWELIASTTR